MADGQMWTLPAPPTALEAKTETFGAEYAGLVRALIEAENSSEQCIAQLALAIFLLGCNYSLSPADYQRLLGSTPECSTATDWQLAFNRIAQEHLDSFLNIDGPPLDSRPVPPTSGRLSRLLAWLRNRLRYRWRPIDSQIS
jgi:hypothetical protein